MAFPKPGDAVWWWQRVPPNSWGIRKGVVTSECRKKNTHVRVKTNKGTRSIRTSNLNIQS